MILPLPCPRWVLEGDPPCVRNAAALSFAATNIAVNGSSIGRTFDSVGAISGGGGNSGLLIDHPPAQRCQILDYLFKLGYGAVVQLLKLEIGGDANHGTANGTPFVIWTCHGAANQKWSRSQRPRSPATAGTAQRRRSRRGHGRAWQTALPSLSLFFRHSGPDARRRLTPSTGGATIAWRALSNIHFDLLLTPMTTEGFQANVVAEPEPKHGPPEPVDDRARRATTLSSLEISMHTHRRDPALALSASAAPRRAFPLPPPDRPPQTARSILRRASRSTLRFANASRQSTLGAAAYTKARNDAFLMQNNDETFCNGTPMQTLSSPNS